MKTEKELFKLKEDVDAAKIAVSELEGQKKAQLKQLSEDWGCKTVEEAEKKIAVMRKDVEKLEEQIETGIEELEERLENPDKEFDEEIEIEKNKKAYLNSKQGRENSRKYDNH